MKLPGRTKTSQDTTGSIDEDVKAEAVQKDRRKTLSESGQSGRVRVTFDESGRSGPHSLPSPPAYGDDASSQLALPINRLSESSRSDGSTEHGIYATTTTTHTIHTTTTFFRLPRRKKQGPLFPLPPKVIPPEHGSSLAVPTDAGNTNACSNSPGSESPAVAFLRMPPPMGLDGFGQGPPTSPSALARTSMSFAAVPGSPMQRQPSIASNRSSPSRRLGVRGRSSTLSSLKNMPSDDALPTPTMASTRTSTSTGRKSFGDLFGLSHRLRQNPEVPYHPSGPGTPGSSRSKDNSMQLTREPVVIPERLENEGPANYLVRLEEAVSRGVVASVLSKGTDSFSQQVLRSYMRGFAFFGDPMDMAIRKLLMEVELPKETQQIDRCLQSFANRYHECNPGIYASPDQAYFIAFSILILHTDVFNKNNKHKMQKADYVKNTRGEGIFEDILECFYDNISYTPFIHVEDDLDINGERIIQIKGKKKAMFPRGGDPTKRPSKEPIDPYTLIFDKELDSLRPNLKEVMHLEEHYNYLGTATSLNMRQLLDTFFKTGVLQIKSSRSRPDAFLSDKTITNPEEANPGVVEIKVTKVGLLWRKDAKKKKARSPWQEWGVILTGAQLYFFRNTTWVKSLMHQQEVHVKKGFEGTPVTFNPPIEMFKPDALMSTDDAVALLDSTYNKHKHAFLFVRHGGFEETFLADNQEEMNDWMAKLNYAAAFRTAGVRMRGILSGNHDGQRSRGIRRLDNYNESSQPVQTVSGEATTVRSKIDNKMAQDIMAARREIMQQRINDWEEKLTVSEKQLEAQLRNARHLQILAPIQAKSREQVLIAAGRMSAKLKWMRMETWRLRCHRDILIMDLEEENLMDGMSPSKARAITSSDSTDKQHLARAESRKSTAPVSQMSPQSPEVRPATQPSPSVDTSFGLDDIFTTPPALVSASSFHKYQASWELPPLFLDARSTRNGSVSSAVPTSPILSHVASFPSIKPTPTSDTQRAVSSPQPTPQVDAAEHAALEQAGFVGTEAIDHGGAASSAETPEKSTTTAEKEKLERSKIRRSLHRTLREAHVPTHRGKRNRDSNSAAGLSEDPASAEDVLARGTGSFTVHGKKASVITFGEELSNMSPDERIRLRRNGHRDDGSTLSPATESDFHSILAEPVEFREHRESAASASTATARSFNELHKRLSAHAKNLDARGPGVENEDNDSEAISFSEGRRTPLPPVEDMDEGDADKRSLAGSVGKQAVYYTPDQALSSANPEFHEGPNEPAKANVEDTKTETDVENQS